MNMATSVENTYNKAKETVADKVSDASQGVKDTAENVKQKADGVKKEGQIDEAIHTVTSMGETACSYVKENPVQSALLALGAGYIVGSMFSSR